MAQEEGQAKGKAENQKTRLEKMSSYAWKALMFNVSCVCGVFFFFNEAIDI